MASCPSKPSWSDLHQDPTPAHLSASQTTYPALYGIPPCSTNMINIIIKNGGSAPSVKRCASPKQRVFQMPTGSSLCCPICGVETFSISRETPPYIYTRPILYHPHIAELRSAGSELPHHQCAPPPCTDQEYD